MEGGGLYSDACHVLAVGLSLCGGRPNGGTGHFSSGTNHCLLVSFPLLSELLSRTAPTERKEQERGGRKGVLGCACVQRIERRGPTGNRGVWWGKRQGQCRSLK